MRLYTFALSSVLFASYGLAQSVVNNLQAAQNCLASIQTAQQALDSAVVGLTANSADAATILPQAIQGVETALNQAVIVMQRAQPLNAADAQILLGSVNSLSYSVRAATMSLVLQQPTLNQLGLVNLGVQTLTAQRVVVSQLGQIVVTKVVPVAVPAFQVGFGHALTAVDVGLNVLNGGGSVAVQLIPSGQIPVQGLAAIQQQCTAIGFVPINAINGINGIAVQQQQQLIQHCSAVGFVPANSIGGVQQVFNQQQVLEQQCLAAGLIQSNETQQVDAQDAINQCAAIGFAQQATEKRTVSASSADLNQRCATIGFSASGGAQQQFVASAETCAALGLVAQNNDIAAQCAALGLQPGSNSTEVAQQQVQDQTQERKEKANSNGEEKASNSKAQRREQRIQTQQSQQGEATQQKVTVEQCLAQGFVQANGTAAEGAAARNETASAESQRLVRKRMGMVMVNA